MTPPETYFKDFCEKSLYLKPLHAHMDPQKMRVAVRKILNAKSVFIFGDYDVDGIVATSQMAELVELMGATKIETCLPSRYDGYGATLAEIKPKIPDFDLIVVVDNGTHSQFLKDVASYDPEGKKFLIIDHHPNKELDFKNYPFVLNPNQDGDVSTSTGMVINFLYEFAWTINKEKKIFKKDVKKNHLVDLAAMTALSDMIDLNNGYNRKKVLEGFSKIKQGGREIFKEIKTGDIHGELAFSLNPEINAVGRLAESDLINLIPFHLYLTLDSDNRGPERQVFSKTVKVIKAHNALRKEALSRFSSLAEERIDPSAAINFVFIENAPIGINGLIAQKLYEKTKKPSIAMSMNPYSPGLIVGSGRGHNLKRALEEIKEQSEGFEFSFGGHIEALGIQCLYNHLDKLSIAIGGYKGEALSPLGEGFKDGLLVADRVLSMEEFMEYGKAHERACSRLPFKTKFFAAVAVEDARIIKKYSNGFCKARLNGIEGLAKINEVANAVRSLNEGEGIVALEIPHYTATFSLSIKQIPCEMARKLKENTAEAEGLFAGTAKMGA